MKRLFLLLLTSLTLSCAAPPEEPLSLRAQFTKSGASLATIRLYHQSPSVIFDHLLRSVNQDGEWTVLTDHCREGDCVLKLQNENAPLPGSNVLTFILKPAPRRLTQLVATAKVHDRTPMRLADSYGIQKMARERYRLLNQKAINGLINSLPITPIKPLETL